MTPTDAQKAIANAVQALKWVLGANGTTREEADKASHAIAVLEGRVK